MRGISLLMRMAGIRIYLYLKGRPHQLVISELFSLAVAAEALRANIY